MIRFEVPGNPAPQGSKSVGKRGKKVVLYESSKKVKPWRAAVQTVARQHCAHLLEGAVRVEIIFYMPAPQRMPKDRVHPSVMPDIDKLCRATLDALTGIAYKDDSQVTALPTYKRYHPKGWTGAHITISKDE